MNAFERQRAELDPAGAPRTFTIGRREALVGMMTAGLSLAYANPASTADLSSSSGGNRVLESNGRASGIPGVDDAPEIQAAIDAMPGHGTVCLPPGAYNVMTPIILRPGVALVANHPGEVTLRA